VFFQQDSGLRPKDAPWNMAAAMVLFAALCLLIGIFPGVFYQFLPYPVDYEPYKPDKVVFYLQLLLFSGLAFFLMLPLMKRTLTISLDVDWVWRVALFRLWQWLSGISIGLHAKVTSMIARAGDRLLQLAYRYIGRPKGAARPGVLARAWPIGVTALWIAVLLTAYLLIYYF
jgi:multicomponent Na+:H+ antiporter subunit D